MLEIIAVIGSRTPSEKSIHRVRDILTKKLSYSDFAIVTGGAYGIDTVGMEFACCYGLPLTVYTPLGFHNSSYCDYCRTKANCKVVNTGLEFNERNTLIINDCHIVLAGDFGNGTIDAFEKAIKQNKNVYVCGEYIKGKYIKRIPSKLIHI